MSRIGRRLGAGSGTEIPRYIKHPLASSGNSWLLQADALDAGTVHILDSNISHLDAVNMRHLFWDHTVGAIANTDGWDATYSDAPNSSGGTTSLPWCIAWDYRTARCYPMPAMIADRDLPDGGLGLREIRVELYVYIPVGKNLQVFAALTPTEAPPTAGSLALATAYGTLTAPTAAPSSGLLRVEVVLRTEAPAGQPMEQWGTVPVHQAFLWVGWRGDDTGIEIQNISAFEVSPPVTLAPNEAGGLLAWYRADSIATTSDDYYAGVNRLLDLSGNERHANLSNGSGAGYGQGVGTQQLTLDGSTPMLYFDSSQYSCPHESALNPTTWTMFFVWKPDGPHPVWNSLFNKGTYNGTEGHGFGLADRTHSATAVVSGWVDDESLYFVDHSIPGETELLWLTYDGSTLQLFRNNISVGTVAKVGYLTNSGDLVVGGMDGDLGGQGFLGAWGECGLYNRCLTATERNDLWWNYFKPRYRKDYGS